MKISVVIPTLNAEKHLEAALSSIWMQKHSDIEIVVMDGGSRDRTTEILKRNADRIHHWESKPDGGTSQAMNEGFARSTGDLVTFLCSDDRFKDPDVFSDVIKFISDKPEVDAVCTELEGHDETDPTFKYLSKSSLDDLRHKMTVNLPGAFFRRSLLKERQFSSDVEVANDYELFVFLKEKRGARFAVMDRLAVIFSMGGRTNHPDTDFAMLRDCAYLRFKYYGVWPAVPLLARDVVVSVLRKFHIRPKRWMRFLKRSLLAKSMNDSRVL